MHIQITENPISTIYKVKEELNGGSGSSSLMSSMCYAKKGMQVETQDREELTDIKEGDIINLLDLLFTENRDYLVKYNDQKVCTICMGCHCTCFSFANTHTQRCVCVCGIILSY